MNQIECLPCPQVRAWRFVVQQAQWKTFPDVRKTYGAADQVIPAFPHNGQDVDLSTTTLRLKLHGAPTALEDHAGCFYSTFSAIVAQNCIVSDTH
jgi:HigB_toxin, RelE-like toxic component of a toxin-antitoxin system